MTEVYSLVFVVLCFFGLAFWQDYSSHRKMKRAKQQAKRRLPDPVGDDDE